jgi:predicted lipoprotein with Yx(FWY)xxD motif
MRKSGPAVAAAVGALALLLTACGGSSSSSAASSPSSSPTGQPTSILGITPGTTVLIVQYSKVGYVLAEASGYVVYTYGNDKQGGPPTCTGSCSDHWTPVTGRPLASQAAKLPGKLGTVTMADGGKQITYNGYPLYTYKGAGPLSVSGDGLGGLWHVIKLSASDVASG